MVVAPQNRKYIHNLHNTREIDNLQYIGRKFSELNTFKAMKTDNNIVSRNNRQT